MKNSLQNNIAVCCNNCKHLHTAWNKEPCSLCSNYGKNKKRKLFEPLFSNKAVSQC